MIEMRTPINEVIQPTTIFTPVSITFIMAQYTQPEHVRSTSFGASGGGVCAWTVTTLGTKECRAGEATTQSVVTRKTARKILEKKENFMIRKYFVHNRGDVY
jgi:hypothetical protein